ncbi:MAG: replicative DNA helicase [Planctomycetota bacterium]
MVEEKGNSIFTPANIDAERALLGSVLISPKTLPQLIELLKPDYLYLPKHKNLFELYVKIFDKYHEFDINLLREEISRSGYTDLDDSYLNELARQSCSPTLLEYYAGIIKDKFKLRQLIKACEDTLTKIKDNEEAEELLVELEKVIFDIGQGDTEEKVSSIGKILQGVLTILEERLEGITPLVGLPTGFPELDNIIGGFAPSNYIVVAGRPGLGKTSFILNLVYNIALRGEPVLLFTLEAEHYMVVHNLLCSVAGVNTFLARKGNLSVEERMELNRAASVLEDLPIYIDNSKNITPFELRLIARKCRKQYGIRALFVDYLQLMSGGSGATYGSSRIENRQQEIAYISRSLKILATELNIPVIAVAQLSRSVETREGHRPLLSDLRESGAIEQDADIVLFLFREDYYLREQTPPEKKGICEVIVAKNRYGPTDTTFLKFNLPTMKFESLNTPHNIKVQI